MRKWMKYVIAFVVIVLSGISDYLWKLDTLRWLGAICSFIWGGLLGILVVWNYEED